MKKFQFLFLLCFITMAASAQNDFLLYSYKGNVSVVENNVESKAKVGKPLNGSATVKVAAGSVVTLICNEAAMFTITKAGTYPLNKFGDSCKISSNSVSANYVKYVWASMTKSSGSPGSNRKAYMNTVGAVSRGDINNIWIDYRLDTLNYSGGTEFPVSWKSYADAKEFEFSLFSHDNISTPVHTTFVGKLKLPVADFANKMKQGNSYYWTASIKGEQNDDLKIINYVTKETFAAVLETIKKQGAAFEGPAEQAYRIA
ncbi:MAG TPA: hypothetical protein VGO58_00055, partial [Chitinophagaceae bacterium]|nr:hypothetical protein [Chitinophagaceae bacterium]